MQINTEVHNSFDEKKSVAEPKSSLNDQSVSEKKKTAMKVDNEVIAGEEHNHQKWKESDFVLQTSEDLLEEDITTKLEEESKVAKVIQQTARERSVKKEPAHIKIAVDRIQR